jgi:hypothetical protein
MQKTKNKKILLLDLVGAHPNKGVRCHARRRPDRSIGVPTSKPSKKVLPPIYNKCLQFNDPLAYHSGWQWGPKTRKPDGYPP